MTKKDLSRFRGSPYRKIADGSDPHGKRLPSIITTISDLRKRYINESTVDDLNIAYIGRQNASVDLTGRTLEQLVLIDCLLSELILERVTVERLFLINTSAEKVNCQQLKTTFAIVEKCTLKYGNFRQLHMPEAWLNGDFEESNFEESHLKDSIWVGSFQTCSFIGVDARGCWLHSVNLRNANFSKGHISGLKLAIVSTAGAILPDGRSFNTFPRPSFDEFP